ncbi:fused response regulator/phosphatase [Brachyspira sp. G79]|uniref:fused response regulator/phosphatase n=1 Tax=Brachyspira sp. G79 TaxID=1358104 RepID=UPI000BBBD1E2|nr:fused response regulator/phosphatase [Brachyspira sp. G79]PCG19722.1 stage II sporulation protein E [Brachyspira sp. G79]
MKNSNILTEKVLIADSNIDYASFLQKFLKESGYLSYIALSYEDALNMAYDKIPDCILVDYMLPNAGASRLSEHIKNDNMLKNIAVLFLTATDNKSECLKSYECGADGFFLKSMDTDILLAKMKAYIRLKKAIESNLMYMNILKQDIEYASKLQKSILSYGNTSIPKNDISIFHYAPNEVSGDYSGIKSINNGWYAILLADVSGHGVAASMLTILIKSFFDSHVIIDTKNTQPSEFLKQMNNFFIGENFDKNLFASVFYAIYNNETGELICSSAGSPKPICKSKDEVMEIDAEGPLIGMMEDTEYTETKIQLNHNDIIFIFTDGAYEIFDKDGKMFGDELLKNTFVKHSHKDVNVIKDCIIKELKSFSNNILSDDISMIMLRRTE